MSLRANQRRRVLLDHFRRGKVYIPPFVHHLGPMKEVSWVNTMIPELCWIALLHAKFGHQKGIELITSLVRTVRSIWKDGVNPPSRGVFAAVSDYSVLSSMEWGRIRESLSQTSRLVDIQEALGPLIRGYPTCPLRGLWESGLIEASVSDVALMKGSISTLFGRTERSPMLVQATAIWLWFDSGKFKVFPGLALSRFPEIERYPSTELSKQVGSSIRATLQALFGQASYSGSGFLWPVEFWNQGLVLGPCEFEDG